MPENDALRGKPPTGKSWPIRPFRGRAGGGWKLLASGSVLALLTAVLTDAASRASQKGQAKDEASSGGWKSSVRALVIVLLAAVLTGAVTYVYGVVSDVRKAKLDFVNAQIEKLYGPLYSATMASKTLWKTFHPLHPNWRDTENPPTIEQVKLWRHWMKTVFQPLNLRAEEAIIANSHLVIGGTMPIAFRELIAHVEGYKGRITAWSDDDFKSCGQPGSASIPSHPCPAQKESANLSLLRFPSNLDQCVTEDFAMLKGRQEKLQGSIIGMFLTSSAIRSPACDLPSVADVSDPSSEPPL